MSRRRNSSGVPIAPDFYSVQTLSDAERAAITRYTMDKRSGQDHTDTLLCQNDWLCVQFGGQRLDDSIERIRQLEGEARDEDLRQALRAKGARLREARCPLQQGRQRTMGGLAQLRTQHRGLLTAINARLAYPTREACTPAVCRSATPLQEPAARPSPHPPHPSSGDDAVPTGQHCSKDWQSRQETSPRDGSPLRTGAADDRPQGGSCGISPDRSEDQYPYTPSSGCTPGSELVSRCTSGGAQARPHAPDQEESEDTPATPKRRIIALDTDPGEV